MREGIHKWKHRKRLCLLLIEDSLIRLLTVSETFPADYHVFIWDLVYFHLLVCLVFFVAQVCLFFHSIRMKLILTILFYYDYHWLWSAICFLPDFSGQNAANITSFQDFANDCLKCRVIWLVRYLRCVSFQHKVSVFKRWSWTLRKKRKNNIAFVGVTVTVAQC